MNDADAAFAAAFPGEPLSPAVLAEDGRGPVARRNETRDRAARVAGGIAVLEAASSGLTRVQQLVGRLRDVAIVAIDRSLPPGDRATLQRQVDQALSEIDAVADATMMDDRLLRAGTATRALDDGSNDQRASFRAIGTTMLGLTGLAVRSSDQAFAASGALDVATARLERNAGTLHGATARLQKELHALTSPRTTVLGDPAIGSDTAALTATITLNAHLLASPHEGVRAQGSLDTARVTWLLDSPLP